MTAPRLALLLATLVVAACAVGAGGCGLFDTAQPELPDAGIVIPPDFTLPDSLLATIERAVERKSSSNYGLCLTDSLGNQEPGFYATFDPADLSEWTNLGNPDPGTWTRREETRFFPSFLAFNPNADYEMYLSPVSPDNFDVDGDTKIYYRRYRVYAAGIPIAAGVGVLTMDRVGLSGEWKLRFWEDRRDTAGVLTMGRRRLSGQ